MVILRILQEKYSFPSFGQRAKALALEWMSTQYVQNRYDLLPYFRPSQWTAERDVDRGKMRSLQIVPCQRKLLDRSKPSSHLKHTPWASFPSLLNLFKALHIVSFGDKECQWMCFKVERHQLLQAISKRKIAGFKLCEFTTGFVTLQRMCDGMLGVACTQFSLRHLPCKRFLLFFLGPQLLEYHILVEYHINSNSLDCIMVS